MKCPNCNERLLTRKERKYKHCLRCGHDFSLIKGKVEFSKEVKSQEELEIHIDENKDESISAYILHKIMKKDLLESPLKCEQSVFMMQEKLNGK